MAGEHTEDFRLLEDPMGPLSRRSWLVRLVIALALLPGTTRAGSLIGNSIDGTLYDINPSTGAATAPRGTGLDFLAGIAPRPDGTLFGLTAVSGTPEQNA